MLRKSKAMCVFKRLLIVLSIGLICLFLSPHNVNAEVERNDSDYVLILNSYSESTVWSTTFIDPIKHDPQFRELGLSVCLEHLDISNMTVDSVDVTLRRITTLRESSPRLLVVLGNRALGLIHPHLLHSWREVPTVLFTQLNSFAPWESYLTLRSEEATEQISIEEVLHTHANLSVVYLPVYVEETIRLMKQVMPSMRSLSFVSDSLLLSNINRQQFLHTLTNSPELSMPHDVLTAGVVTNDSLISHLSSMTPGEAALLSSWDQQVKHDGNLIMESNSFRLLSNYSSAPIFSLYDIGVEQNGLVGGYFVRHPDIISTFRRVLYEALEGKRSEQPVVVQPAQPVFNFLAMDRHGIKISSLPSNSFVYMKPLSFWDKNKWVIIGVIALIGLFAFLMRVLLLRKAQVMRERELSLLSNYSDLVNNMPIAYQQEQLLFNEAGEPVDYIVSEVNPGFEEQLTPREEIIGKRGSEADPMRAAEMIKIYQMILQDKKTRVNLSYYHEATGRYFSVIISASSTPGYMDLFYVDTTELFKTQQLLRTVNSKLSMSLDIANIIPWRWDIQKHSFQFDRLKPLDENEGASHADHHYTVPEDAYFARIHPDERERVRESALRLVQGDAKKIEEEFRLYNPEKESNEYDWVEMQALVERKDEQGNVVSIVGSSHIITERKKIEAELLRAKEKAEESNRLKSAFLANMSHEIRTPLNAIVGFSNILASSDEDEDKQEYINIIENNNSLLLQLISDMLDLSKFEAGTMEFRYTNVDLNALMTEQLDFVMARVAPGVGVHFDTYRPECYVKVERDRLLQVMQNLLTNAAKFTASGKIRYGYEVYPDNMLRFFVADTGRGVSEEQIDKIFGRFVKLDHFVQGTGLGLSISQTIVHHFGGKIGVESKEGEGSTFWFTFPYTEAAEVEQPEELPVVKHEKLKVLVAEDIPSNFELFEFILKKDFEIIHAWDGKEAVSLFEKHRPHIVLMDINMPKMNGYEATTEIRKFSKDVPIIAVTAYAFSTDEQQIRKNGFSGYTPKPLNPHTLKQQMSDLLSEQPLEG